MKQRWEFWRETKTTIVTVENNAPQRSFLRRVFGLVGKTVFFLLIGALPLLVTYKGVCGLLTGKLVMWSRLSGSQVKYGNEAFGHSWIHIAFGVFFLGWVLGDLTGRPIVKWIVWVIASGLVINGIRFLVR